MAGKTIEDNGLLTLTVSNCPIFQSRQNGLAMSQNSTGGAKRPNMFGKRKEPHTIIIAHGNDIRHFTVKPWMALTGGAFLSAMAFGYLVATSYLVLRDDLIGATVARQARLQHAYEDRISALRTQVDRITSRQLLDQQLMESKVVELIERQDQLTSRGGQLGTVLKKARAELGSIPVPKERPAEKRASLTDPMTTGSLAASLFSSSENAPDGQSAADRADKLFVAINRSLRDIDTAQVKQIQVLAETARDGADRIQAALTVAGAAALGNAETSEGGPFIAADSAEAISSFSAQVQELDTELGRLKQAKNQARRYPLANPAPGADITSTFGTRADPLLGTAAFHSGMDFRGAIGDPIRATAAGKVISAGRNGGYGNMVEIEHANGLTTRYAHMSRIDVAEGDVVASGDLVGAVGSTGRSTGPHLHYEVRRNGDAINPAMFIRAGRKIEDLL
jgi:murein DD-endopeptidase MepM/ murein hydrolase activator NlpD